MGDCDQALAHYATRIDLSWLPEPYPQEVRRTLLVSGDRDLVAQDIPLLKARYGAVAGDWESGAIAYVAARNGVRCLILRGVSDLVGSAGGEAYGRLEVFAENTGEIMRRLVGALPDWLGSCLYPPQSPHFRRPDLGRSSQSALPAKMGGSKGGFFVDPRFYTFCPSRARSSSTMPGSSLRNRGCGWRSGWPGCSWLGSQRPVAFSGW